MRGEGQQKRNGVGTKRDDQRKRKITSTNCKSLCRSIIGSLIPSLLVCEWRAFQPGPRGQQEAADGGACSPTPYHLCSPKVGTYTPITYMHTHSSHTYIHTHHIHAYTLITYLHTLSSPHSLKILWSEAVTSAPLPLPLKLFAMPT